MKKCFVTLAAALAMCGTAVAQISAGDYMIKGRVGLNTAGVLPYESPFGGKYASSYNLVAFTPQFEYFATDRLSVGFSAGILNAWSRDKADYEQLGKSIDKDGVLGYFVGPSVNYYIPLGNRFYLSFNGFIGYFGMSSWSVYKVGDNKEKGSSCANFGILSVVPMLNISSMTVGCLPFPQGMLHLHWAARTVWILRCIMPASIGEHPCWASGSSSDG